MKKAGAILLLCTLLLSQYGRFLAYVRCAISGLVDPSAPCDCEQQLPQAVKGDDARDMTPPKGMDVVFEEYYLPATPWQLAGLTTTTAPRYGDRRQAHSSDHTTEVFRPPGA